MRILYVTLVLVLSDQLTKLLVKGFSIPLFDLYHAGMQLGETIPLIGNYVCLTFVENPGMAFGIDFGGKLYLTLFSIIASIGIAVYLYRIRTEPFGVRLSLAMILGGAIGNLIDRVFYGVIFGEEQLFYGKVVDFLSLPFIKIPPFEINLGFYKTFFYGMDGFPIFNIADSAVTLGVLLLLFSSYAVTSPSGAGELPPGTSPQESDSSTSM